MFPAASILAAAAFAVPWCLVFIAAFRRMDKLALHVRLRWRLIYFSRLTLAGNEHSQPDRPAELGQRLLPSF